MYMCGNDMKKIEVSSNREANSFSLIFQQKKKMSKLCLLTIAQYILVRHGSCILNFLINTTTPNVNSNAKLVLKMLKLKTNSHLKC